MADGTPTRSQLRRSQDTPLSPHSGTKSTGRRRRGQVARAGGPLSSLPTNVDSELPALDTQDTAAGGSASAARGGGTGSQRPAASLGAPSDLSDLPALENHPPGGGAGRHADVMNVEGGVGQGTEDAGLPGPTPGTGGLSSQRELPATPGARGLRTPLSLPRPELGARGGPRNRGAVSSTHDDGDDPVIWGTDIRISALQASIRRFYQHCIPRDQAAPPTPDRDASQQQAPRQPLYMRLLRQVVSNQEPALNIDASDIQAWDATLFHYTTQAPSDVLPVWDIVTGELAAQVALDVGLEQAEDIQVRLFNMPEGYCHAIRDLDPAHIDQIVSARGMVTRTSAIIPELSALVFRCEACHYETISPVDQVGSQLGVKEPVVCGHCNKRNCMRSQPNRSLYTNRQIVKMQEDPSTVPEGETPRALLCYAFDTNVDAVKPGDKVTITGIFRASRMRINPRQRALHSLFKTYLDVVHFGRDDSARMFLPVEPKAAQPSQSLDPTQAGEQMQDGTQVGSLGDEAGALPAEGWASGNLTLEELRAKEERFKAMAADPDIVNKLVRSFAPKVIDMDGVKKGLLCQLFGGVSKRASGRALVRGEINVLLVGDPSVSKSQLLGFVHKASPRGIYTSGKGSSAVGLTAYVTRDPETGEMVLESGALVLSDRGICCIDEFDKMSDGARSMLHEVMEQQTVSVAKAGLVSQLNARTSILAGANPIESRYNRDLSIAENIALPPTLLSRFDLIYLCLDQQSTQRDWALSRHLVSLFHQDIPESQKPPIPLQDLKEYVAYARARCHPRISPTAAGELVARYKRMRMQGRQQQAVIVTPRQLEALIRLSEALARMTLSPEVTVEHVAEANRMWMDAMSTAAADETGQLDMDVLTSGISGETRKFLADALPGLLRDILAGFFAARRHDTSLTATELYEHYNRLLADRQQAAGEAPAADRPRRISKRQMLEALWQLPDLVDVRGETILRKGGGGGSRAADP